MTEEEWLTCQKPDDMRHALAGFSLDRKMRLWACACCRRISQLVTDGRCHRAVEVAEQYADGLASGVDLKHAHRDAVNVSNADFDHWRDTILAAGGDLGEYEPHQGHMEATAATSAFVTVTLASRESDWGQSYDKPSGAADEVLDAVAHAVDPQSSYHFTPSRTLEAKAAKQREAAAQAHFLRDIFGNPFRPVAFDPAWRSEAAVGIARGIYDDRAFERMPILADALQEAGCEHPDILAHCREPGTHVRGCWVVDLVLGKS